MTRNLSVKIVCVLLALVLWAQAAAQQDVEKVVELPLSLTGLPDSLAIRASKAPETIWVRMRESKLERLLHDLLNKGRGKVVVDLSSVGVGEFHHDISVREVVDGGTPLSVESPTALHLRIYPKAQASVPVRVILAGKLEEGLILAGKPEVTPPQVRVEGAAPLVDSLDHVNTQPLKISKRRRSFRETVRLVSPDPDLVLRPVEADVSIAIDEIIERSFEKVPITVVSDQVDTSRVYVQPGFAKLRLKGPAHVLASINANELSVVVHFEDKKGGVYQIEPKVEVPEGVISTTVDPPSFQVIVDGGNDKQ